ncbi:MAG: histidinol-phosphate transaminase [Microbacteriaceae bacterium]|nr:histidinol-phosphate transaminase [Microbacteriaceae bacterium]
MSEARVRLRPDVESVVPYRQGRIAAADAFKLSSNENPFPPLPGVAEALREVQFNRYPEGSARAVRERLATIWQVTPEQIVVTPGSAALLTYLMQATCTAEDEVLYAWRSFEGYPQFVGALGVRSVQVPNRPDGGHDLPAMAAAVTDRTRLVLLCTPNNPTGPTITRDEFEAFMAAIPRTVLVGLDEAYAEFVTDPEAIRGDAALLERHPNLVVLRTFSKAYGLAGLRIGYGVGQEYVMDAIRAVAQPLAVTEPAQLAAIASLDHEPALLERVAVIVERRERIRAGLLEQGWAVPEAQGNFVWLPTGERTAEVAAHFEAAGLVVRSLGEGVRVSIGEADSVEKLLRSAREVVVPLS